MYGVSQAATTHDTDHTPQAQQAILPASCMPRLQLLPSRGGLVPFPVS